MSKRITIPIPFRIPIRIPNRIGIATSIRIRISIKIPIPVCVTITVPLFMPMHIIDFKIIAICNTHNTNLKLDRDVSGGVMLGCWTCGFVLLLVSAYWLVFVFLALGCTNPYASTVIQTVNSDTGKYFEMKSICNSKNMLIFGQKYFRMHFGRHFGS